MLNDTIRLPAGTVEVHIDGNLIYLEVFGTYTDGDVLTMTRYLEDCFARGEGLITRIWNGSRIDHFLLTAQGTDMFRHWTENIKKKWPGQTVYLIAPTSLAYGMSRMYELKTSNELMGIHSLRSVNDLPGDIKARLRDILTKQPPSGKHWSKIRPATIGGNTARALSANPADLQLRSLRATTG